jgi:hypothetical protein
MLFLTSLLTDEKGTCVADLRDLSNMSGAGTSSADSVAISLVPGAMDIIVAVFVFVCISGCSGVSHVSPGFFNWAEKVRNTPFEVHQT